MSQTSEEVAREKIQEITQRCVELTPYEQRYVESVIAAVLRSERDKAQAMREAISRTLDDFVYLERKYKGTLYSTDIGYVLKPRVLELIDVADWLPPAPKEAQL